MAPIELGDVMRSSGIGIVERSRNPKYPEGALVEGLLGWQRYLLTNGRGLFRIERIPGFPLSAYYGFLGHIGLTAYFGLLDIGNPQPGETIAVTAAAGAVGSLVGQIGKIKGCRVVGIAGSDEKCRWLTEELGFDGAINYKAESVRARLRELCPSGIDVIFENVGGAIFDEELALINLHARVALCGLISQYNATERQPGPYYFANLLTKRALLKGFIVSDYFPRRAEAIADLVQWASAGRLKYRLDVVEGLEKAPAALNRLFDGTNEGKLILKVSEES